MVVAEDVPDGDDALMLAPGGVVDLAVADSEACAILRPGNASSLKLTIVLNPLGLSFLWSDVSDWWLIRSRLLRWSVLLLLSSLRRVIIKLIIEPIIEAIVKIVVVILILLIIGL